MSQGSLAEYSRKRDFRATPEPSGEAARRAAPLPRFVVQKHDASHLHYDFRLEVDGVLVSWAVPKGPATDPTVKRLAVRTEDHPLDYIDFEGVIPYGQYGAGRVIVWDRGTYRNLKEEHDPVVPMAEALARGHITVWLEGAKLTGGYALTSLGKGKNWLLVKMRDEQADEAGNPVAARPESVLSGRVIEDLESPHV